MLAEGLKQSAEAVTERKRAECTSMPEAVDVTTGEEDERNLLHVIVVSLSAFVFFADPVQDPSL